MNKCVKVLGLGNAIVDLQVRVSDSEFEALGLRKSTMNLVDLDTQEELLQSINALDFRQSSGGSAANTIITLAAMGESTGYCCAIGGDELGDFYLNEMKELGVCLSAGKRAGQQTGTSAILVTPDAERTMNTHLGASASFNADDIKEEDIKNAEWLYIEGYLFSTETGVQAANKAVELAKKHQTRISLTLSDVFIVECFRDAVSKVVEDSELVFANINEAKAFTGVDSEEKAFEELAKIVPTTVVTLSERGSWISTNGEVHKQDALSTTAIDETGAGDAFAAGFIFGIVSDKPVDFSAKLGTYLASSVVSQLGPRLRNNKIKDILDCI